jgi:hypothetical protein
MFKKHEGTLDRIARMPTQHYAATLRREKASTTSSCKPLPPSATYFWICSSFEDPASFQELSEERLEAFRNYAIVFVGGR